MFLIEEVGTAEKKAKTEVPCARVRGGSPFCTQLHVIEIDFWVYRYSELLGE